MIEYFKYMSPSEKWQAFSFAVHTGDIEIAKALLGL
jgi:hypothetical protein